jgi:hypothetical protein
VIEFGSNNMRKTNKPVLEIARIVARYRRIMAEAQKAKVRVLLCGTIPDPRPAVDSRLKLLDEALNDLEMGEGNKFLALRGSLLDAQGEVRKDIFKPRGDVHLNALGTQIVSLRIQQTLGIMLPNLVQTPPAPAPVLAQAPVPGPAPVQTAPVQTPPAKPLRVRVQAPVQDEVPVPVVVNAPSVVGAPLVAVVNALAVAQAPAGVQQLVGQVQDLVLQHVAVQNVVPEISTAMETDEDELLAKLFFKKYGRALPEEKEKEKDEVDINFVIDLTDEKDDMEVETPAPVAVVKTEPIEIANVSNVANVSHVANVNVVDATKRRSFRLERIELAKARKALNEFGKSLRKSEVIPEKEAPLAAGNVIADTDTDMAEDRSVESDNNVNVGSITTDEAIEMAEKAIADSDAAIKANRDEFDD